jgi:hypothetical protein
MKLSITSHLEFITSVEPFVHYRADGVTGNGTGEVFLDAQAVEIILPAWHHRICDSVPVS